MEVKKNDNKALRKLQDKVKGLKRGTYENKATGYKADINAKTLNKIINPTHSPKFSPWVGNYIENLNAAIYLPELFENAVYPGIENMLAQLEKKGYILAVASSKPEVYVRQIMDHFGLTRYFTEIGGSELNGRRTNKTEVIEDVLKRLNMDKHRDQVIMVGDKEHDVYGARKAGLECIAVSFGYGTEEELKQAKPLKIVDSAEGIVDFFA